MDRIDKLLALDEFWERLRTIERNEADRIYCKHGFDHLLSVARIMHIENLEKGMNIDKEVIYATGLLHDIGRSVSAEHHDEESAKLAVHMLRLCDFDDEEIDTIVRAIMSHRVGSNDAFGDLLYRADKASRDCFNCMAQDTCKWTVKNKRIIS